MRLFATVSDACAILSRVGLPLSERQVRYVGLTPQLRVAGLNGGRLFDAEDVTVLAVFAALLRACQRWGLPLWTARAALRYREAEVRRAIQRKASAGLVLDPVTGTATLAGESTDAARAIDIQGLAVRVRDALTAHRAQYPEIWTGAAYVQREDLPDVRRVAREIG
jgi:hypothetical protein